MHSSDTGTQPLIEHMLLFSLALAAEFYSAGVSQGEWRRVRVSGSEWRRVRVSGGGL